MNKKIGKKTGSTEAQIRGTQKEQPRLMPILTQFSISVLENMEVVLYNKGYQMIELFILLQLIQVLTPG